MQDIAFDDLTEADLQRLVDNEVPEGRQLEYKQALWSDTGDGQKEYLNDLASFANAQDGDLVVGMAEMHSIATDLVGLDVTNPHDLQTALENRHRNRLEPPITGIRMRWIDLTNGRRALVIRVPSSLSGPHRERQSGHFFIRGETRKDQMGIHELRDAFVGAERLTERLRQLHIVAVDVAHRPELPFEVSSEPAAVVSVMPLDVLRTRRDLAITVGKSVPAYRPSASDRDWNIILEGIVLHAGPEPVRSFALTHRQGRVDAFWTIGGDRLINGQDSVGLIFPDNFQAGLIDMVTASQTRLRQHGVDGPWIVMTSLVGIAGAQLPISQTTLESGPPIRRNTADLPDIIDERVDEEALRPVFSAFWRVFGRDRA